MKEYDYENYKQKVDGIIFHKTDDRPITFGQIKVDLEPDDIISAGYEEPLYGSDSAHDGYYYLTVSRVMWESEDEFNERMEQAEEEERRKKDLRRKNYEELKKEFENEK